MKNNDEFPKLTILSDAAPSQPRLTMTQKYGMLFWLGLGGIIFSLSLVLWFSWHLLAMRDVWKAIYVLHDESRTAGVRIQAAESLIKDDRVEASQLQPMIFRKSLPARARYLIAESIDKAVTVSDARQMLGLIATTGANSPPDWLRGHLSRLAAISIPADNRFPADQFQKLSGDDDPIVAGWAAFGLTKSPDAANQALGKSRLTEMTEKGSAFAQYLLAAVQSESTAQAMSLRRAVDQMRVETEQNRKVLASE